MTETSTLPKLQSFLTSISGWFEYIATKWRAYLEANQLWTCFPSCENMSWKLFTRGIYWLPQEWRGNWCRQCRNSSRLSRLAWCKRSRLSLRYGDTIWLQTILVTNLPCCFI
jgi:hypothetical protein